MTAGEWGADSAASLAAGDTPSGARYPAPTRRSLTPMTHRMPPRAALALLALVLAVGACGGAASTAGPAAPSADPAVPTAEPAAPTASTPEATLPTGTATAEPAPQPVLDQPWATAELLDVATGETLTIAALAAAGRPVIVETMAIWCSNCLAQQKRIEEALAGTGPDEAAYVVLTIDPAEDAARLARYRDQHGFQGIYAVAPRDVAQALAAEFGDQVLNPPATPVVVISPSGRVTLTPYGPKSVDDIRMFLEDHRS